MDRTKPLNKPTSKQNKWKDPFFAQKQWYKQGKKGSSMKSWIEDKIDKFGQKPCGW